MADILPSRLEVGVNPASECALYDVYFNGRLQKNCVIADVTKGYIKRYQRHFGLMARNGAGRPMMEEKRGRVVIVLKGQTPGN